MRWNPWHGCRKLSEGCRHCYVYRIDSRIDLSKYLTSGIKSVSVGGESGDEARVCDYDRVLDIQSKPAAQA